MSLFISALERTLNFNQLTVLIVGEDSYAAAAAAELELEGVDVERASAGEACDVIRIAAPDAVALSPDAATDGGARVMAAIEQQRGEESAALFVICPRAAATGAGAYKRSWVGHLEPELGETGAAVALVEVLKRWPKARSAGSSVRGLCSSVVRAARTKPATATARKATEPAAPVIAPAPVIAAVPVIAPAPVVAAVPVIAPAPVVAAVPVMAPAPMIEAAPAIAAAPVIAPVIAPAPAVAPVATAPAAPAPARSSARRATVPMIAAVTPLQATTPAVAVSAPVTAPSKLERPTAPIAPAAVPSMPATAPAALRLELPVLPAVFARPVAPARVVSQAPAPVSPTAPTPRAEIAVPSAIAHAVATTLGNASSAVAEADVADALISVEPPAPEAADPEPVDLSAVLPTWRSKLPSFSLTPLVTRVRAAGLAVRWVRPPSLAPLLQRARAASISTRIGMAAALALCLGLGTVSLARPAAVSLRTLPAVEVVGSVYEVANVEAAVARAQPPAPAPRPNANAITEVTTEPGDMAPEGDTTEAEVTDTNGTADPKVRRANLLVGQGHRLFKEARFGMAEDAYLKALAVLPKYPRALAGLVRVHLARRDGVEALRWARLLTQRQPKRGNNQLLLGDAYALMGVKDAARNAWRTAYRYGNGEAHKRLQGVGER